MKKKNAAGAYGKTRNSFTVVTSLFRSVCVSNSKHLYCNRVHNSFSSYTHRQQQRAAKIIQKGCVCVSYCVPFSPT